MRAFFSTRRGAHKSLSLVLGTKLTMSNVAKPPLLEITNISDEPANGYTARVAYKNGRVEFSHYPQLGPRKSDPADPMPQFDFDAKLFYRATPRELCELIAVTKGKVPETTIKTFYGATVSLKATDDGYTLHIESPSGDRSGDKNRIRSCSVPFTSQYATGLKNFLEFSIEKYFGFDKTDKFHSEKKEADARQKVSKRHETEKAQEKPQLKVSDLDDW